MAEPSPLPTPAQRQFGEIQTRIELEMMRNVDAAIREATERALAEVRAAGLEMPPPSADYFAAKVHQNLYCTLCKADPSTFSGGSLRLLSP
jgi:hypothetical protein